MPMIGTLTTTERVLRVRLRDGGAAGEERDDELAVEEPLEIRIDGQSWSITMRTPGDDLDLVAGFLVGEGVITSPAHLVSLGLPAGALDGNSVNAVLAPGAPPGAAAMWLMALAGLGLSAALLHSWYWHVVRTWTKRAGRHAPAAART